MGNNAKPDLNAKTPAIKHMRPTQPTMRLCRSLHRISESLAIRPRAIMPLSNPIPLSEANLIVCEVVKRILTPPYYPLEPPLLFEPLISLAGAFSVTKRR